MKIDIPKGQRVRIRKYDGTGYRTASGKRDITFQKSVSDLNDTNFILMEPVTFNISSSFSELMQTEQPNVLQYLGGELLKTFGANKAAGVVTGVTEYSGFQRWSGTGVIDTELSLGIISQGDAYNDVVKPMLNLIKLTIPQVNVNGEGLVGKARTLRLPGPSVIKVINEVFNANIGSDSTYTESDTEFTICVGNLVFDHVVITSVTPTIMPDTDENGYPLSVFLKVRFKGTRIPNDQMIDEIFAGWEEYV